MKRHIIIIFIFLCCGLGSCGPNHQKSKVEDPTILVFAAASLTDVITEIADSFELDFHTNVRLNFASSGTLARQIEQGGKPDVFISANALWMEYLDSLNYLVEGKITVIARNELVLIGPTVGKLAIPNLDYIVRFDSLIGNERISIGDPSHVPAGMYAKQSLEYFGWYYQIKNNILPAKDVRSALMVVELGETPLGIVYRTDALKSTKVKILGTFPSNSHQPIVYMAGLCSQQQIATDFYHFLASKKAKGIWEKYGFIK